jgi:membrane protein required for beta-lactamase induction
MGEIEGLEMNKMPMEEMNWPMAREMALKAARMGAEMIALMAWSEDGTIARVQMLRSLHLEKNCRACWKQEGNLKKISKGSSVVAVM